MLMLDEMRYGYQIKLVIYSSVKFGCHGDTGGGERRLTRKKCHFFVRIAHGRIAVMEGHERRDTESRRELP